MFRTTPPPRWARSDDATRHSRSLQRPDAPRRRKSAAAGLRTASRSSTAPVIGVNNISCRIGPGITGLLGANGAGKIDADQAGQRPIAAEPGNRADRRRIDAWSTAAKHHLGYSPDLNSFYEEMTGREFVYTMARLHGFSRAEARERTDVRAGRSRHGRSGRSAAGRLQPRHAAAHQAGPGPGPRSLAVVARRAAVGHRSRRPARDQRAAVPAGRAGQDDPGFEPHPGRDRAAGRLDRDDVARPDRGLRHAGRDARPDAVSAADGRDRRRAGPPAGGAVGRTSRRAGRRAARQRRWWCGRAIRSVFRAARRAGLRSTGSTCGGCRRSIAGPTPCSTTCSRDGHEPAPRLDHAHLALVSAAALVGQHADGAAAAGRLLAVRAAAAFRSSGVHARASSRTSASS